MAEWDDEKFPAYPTQKNVTQTYPEYDHTNIGWIFRDNYDDGPIKGIGQFSHSRKSGSDIYPHFHWDQTEAGTPYFQLDYKWYDNDGAVPAGFTTVYSTGNAFTYSSGTLGQITDFAAIDGSGITGLSSVFKWKLTRLATNGSDTFEANLLMSEFDVHYLKNRLGSTGVDTG